MRDAGFFTPQEVVGQLEARLFRAARIVVDTSLHTDRMSFDEAVSFMHEKALLPWPTARSEVARYCAWPTQASAYLTGAMAIERERGTTGWPVGGGLPQGVPRFIGPLRMPCLFRVGGPGDRAAGEPVTRRRSSPEAAPTSGRNHQCPPVPSARRSPIGEPGQASRGRRRAP